MKNFILNWLFITICAFSISAQSQVTYTGLKKDYTQSMDSLLLNINKMPITTGILYDRIMPFANLNLLKENGLITKANYATYIQSYSELYRSAYRPTFPNVANLKTSIATNTNPNLVDIGIINTKINYIDYGLPTQKSMAIINGRFANIASINPFLEKQITIIAPLKDKIRATKISFRVLPSFILQLSGSPIKNLVANFGTATNYSLIKNQVITSTYPTISFETSGEKTFTFTITFSDNSNETLIAAMYIDVPPVQSSTLYNKLSFPLEEDFVAAEGITTTTTGNIAFKGYNETKASKGVLEYRTYYNTVTNNGSAPSKIRKEIILLDGYDPTDSRKIYKESIGYDGDAKSLYELMYYDDDDNTGTDQINLVEKLRAAPYGFDVTLVNFPNGADYIERNAMAFVALLQRENSKLATHGSTEKIAIIGPSMGGLVSRFALAYMEKKGMNHNTKLWVSFDSPHLGANIPISAQESIYFFGFNGKLEDAKTKFTENFFTSAARQMLIEQLDYRHQANPNLDNPDLFSGTFTAGQNNDSPFRKQFTTSINTNGLPNSNGFPQNLRKVAIINGTSNGTKTFSENEKYLELASFVKAKLGQIFGTEIIFRYKAASFENRFQAAPNSFSQTFSGLATVVSDLAVVQATVTRKNLNPRGSMDNVPGGTYAIADVIQNGFNKGIDALSIINERDWRVDNYHKAAFIPSVSALAFKNPNFDWSTAINRNLVCDPNSKEIYFDSYFSPTKNEDHVYVSAENANWLINELQGNPQAPHFPIQDGSLTGPDLICSNSTYSFSDSCKIPSTATWSVSPNLQIVASTNYSVTVAKIADGQGTITATFQNGQTVIKNIWIGLPTFRKLLTYSNIPYDQFQLNGPYWNPTWDFSTNNPNDQVEEFIFKDLNDNVILTKPANNGRVSISASEIGITNGETKSFYVYNKNACGTVNPGKKILLKNTIYCPTFCDYGVGLGCNLRRLLNPVVDPSFYKIYPNPTNTIVTIDLKNQNYFPEKNAIVSGELYDTLGISRSKVEIKDNIASFSVIGLLKGIYILKIYINDQVESHQIAVE